jgi:hypothetical protein
MAEIDRERFSIIPALWASLALALTLWLFGPATIYYTNVLEFNYQFVWGLPGLAAGAVATLALLVVWPALLRRSRRRAAALILVLAALLWLQGTFLVWNYGPLDGREIPWGRLWPLGLIDGLVWLAGIAWALLRPDGLARRARAVALALIFVQAGWVGWLVWRAPKVPSFQHYALDETDKYVFSSDRNAIVLLLDTFQSDIFQELINDEPAWRNLFGGFTYYRNALANGAKTFTAVPALLTGRAYDNSRPLLDFIEEAYRAPTSLPRRLGAAGYRVELYPYPGTEKTVFFSDEIAANMERRTSRRMLAGQLGQLLDISLFRQAPHIVKPFIYNDQAWLLKRLLVSFSGSASGSARIREDGRFRPDALKLPDVQFISRMLANATATARPPVFKYFHLNGMHRPLELDRRLHIRRMSYGQRESFKEQARAGLEITRLFLTKLKELGVYDRSLIVVMGDHGSADYPLGVDLAAAGLRESASGQQRIPSHIKAAGLPLVLIKRPETEMKELAISDAPIEETDLPRSLTTFLGFDAGAMPGRAVSTIGEGETRERRFFYYNWNGWGDKYLYAMHEYAVNGHAWLDSSWREVGVRRPGESGEAYPLGTVLGFGPGGNAMPYQGIGWHAPEKSGFTWTREKRAELFLTVKPPTEDLVLRVFAMPYLVPGHLEAQQVGVEINGFRLATLTLRTPGENSLRVVIPRMLLRRGTLHLVFDLPDASAPADLGVGGDVRFLGLAVRALVLAPAANADAADLGGTPSGGDKR